jgi:hypothetical protein
LCLLTPLRLKAEAEACRSKLLSAEGAIDLLWFHSFSGTRIW